MNLLGTLVLIALLAGGGYFAFWAIKRTLADDTNKSRKQRRGARRG